MEFFAVKRRADGPAARLPWNWTLGSLAVLLVWGAQHFDWVEMKGQTLRRIGLLAALMAAAAVVYFGALWAAGLKLRQLLRR